MGRERRGGGESGEGERGRQTDRQAGRQTDRQAGRQADRHRQTDKTGIEREGERGREG